MTLEAFFNDFSYIADAPNGVKKLRELILQLAVRGKLVPQDPADEPASKLLERIQEEKARLVEEKKIRKTETPSKVSANEVPYSLPIGWVWVRLGNLGLTQTGSTPTTAKPEYFGNDYPFIKPADISETCVRYDSGNGLSQKGIEKGRLIPAYSVLMVCIGGSISKVNFIDRECSCNQQINTISPYDGVDYRMLKFFMASPFFKEQVINNSSSTTLPILSKAKWEMLPILLPPLAEQHRIVAKVDQLMSLCDDLESKQEKQRQKLTRLNNAALDRLLTAQEQAEFDVAWELIRDNFDLLYATPGTIGKLRQAILQLAVQGKLVPQDPADEPASKLLDRIQEEKARLVEDKKIRRTDQLTPINSRDEPYGVPQGWAWTYLGEISNTIHYGYSASADHNIKDVRLLRITDIQNNHVNWETVPGCEISIDTVNSYTLNNGDLLIARTGGTIGKTYLVENINVCAVFASYLIRVVPNQFSLPTYFKLFAETPLYWQQLYEKSMGTGQPNVNGISLSQLLLPLPPLAEQHRIVAKVDLLMSLCDDLEARLVKGQAMAEKLTHAAVSTILKE